LKQPAGGFWLQDGSWANPAIGIIMNAFIIIALVVVIVPVAPPAPCHCFWLCLPLFGGVAAGLILSAFAPGDATAREDMVRVKGRRGSGQSKYISDFGRFYGARYTEKKVYDSNSKIGIFKVFNRSHKIHSHL